MAAIRWWAGRIGKPQVVLASNDDYGIPRRQLVSNINKAQQLTEEQIQKIDDELLRWSLRLQQAFGLRRAESIKFRPSFADQGDCIRIKGSWAKNGRPRTIPIVNQQQRDLLNQVHSVAGKDSLIPPSKPYIYQENLYNNRTKRAGLRNLHGLRHAYAQRRYKELSGWECPFEGGPRRRDMTPEQRQIDDAVRLTVSRELGHNRIQITSVYLGS